MARAIHMIGLSGWARRSILNRGSASGVSVILGSRGWSKRTGSPPRPRSRAIVQHFTASDGLQLAYAIDDFTDPWTSASTLLLLHAAMGHSGHYYAWVPRLSRHYRVVRVDLRGHGASEHHRPTRRSQCSG